MERAVAKAIAKCRKRDPYIDELVERMGGAPKPHPVMVSPGDVCVTALPPERTSASISRAELTSAKRAMHSFVRKFPKYGLISGGGRGHLALYERGDDLSAMWAKLNSQRQWFVPLVSAEAALKHLNSGRNEPFVVHRKRRLDFRITSTGRHDTRRRKQFFDINLPG
jgi:hypothetical protein